LFHKDLAFEDYIENPGQTGARVFERFDLQRAIHDTSFTQMHGFDQAPLRPKQLLIFTSMEDFFSTTFVGNAQRRERDVLEVVQILETVVEHAKNEETLNSLTTYAHQASKMCLC